MAATDKELLRVYVAAIEDQSDCIKSIELRRRDGGPLPLFDAGSHIDVLLPNALRRSYSLMNAPGTPDVYILGVGTTPTSRGGSSYIHRTLKPGDEFDITAPRNNFALDETATTTVLIAGGIGVTPMLAMIHRLEAIGAQWRLHYAVRSRAAGGFLGFLAQYGDRVHLHVDEEHGGRPMDIAAIIRDLPQDAHVYCCGPGGMLNAFLEASKSLPAMRVHYEFFTSDQEAAKDGGFELVLARSGVTLQVPAGKTVLDAVLDHGIDIDYSCQEGHCGTCVTKVLEGIPDHRDIYLTEDEQNSNEMMTICCSGSKSARLVLDL
jgi:ferredoxin-NADP reductase